MFDTHISISMGMPGGQIYPPPLRKYVDISASNGATELTKKKKNPHTQLLWGGINFQTSIYHSFPLKPGCIKNTPSLMKIHWLSQLIMDLQRSSTKQKNPHVQLIWDGINFQKTIYQSFPLKLGHILEIIIYI